MRIIALKLMFLLPFATIAQYNYNWAHSLGSTSGEGCYGLNVDHASNVIITGEFKQTIDFDFTTGVANRTSAGVSDIFIAKYDLNANLLWAHRFGNVGGDNGWTVTTDLQDNVYAIGGFVGPVDFDPSSGTATLTSSGSAGYVAKYDANGNYQWAFSLEAANNEILCGVGTDQNGNVYVTGTFDGAMDCDPGTGTAIIGSSQRNAFLAKYDPNGNYLWAFSLGGTTNDYGWDLVNDSLNNVYLVGSFGNTADFDPSAGVASITSSGGFDAFIAKYDSLGNYQWAGAIQGTSNIEAYGVDIGPSGNIAVCGLFRSTADMNIFSGTNNISSTGLEDIFVAKYDPNGNHLWSFGVGSSSDDEARDIAIDSQGRIAITGWIEGTADMDPGSGTQTLTPNIRDGVIAKYDGAGNYIWAGNLGGTGSGGVMSWGVGVTSTDIYACGLFGGSSSSDFDAGSGTANITPVGSNDVFLVRYTDVTVGETERVRNQVAMFPNPAIAGGRVSVQSNSEVIRKVNIYSIGGALLRSVDVGRHESTISLGGLPAGAYVVETGFEGRVSERMRLIVR